MYCNKTNTPADLVPEAQCRRQGEGPARLRSPELCQVLPLQLHDDVVEAVVAAAADEPANVFAALQLLQHGHLHLEHLLWLLRGLQLERHLQNKINKNWPFEQEIKLQELGVQN